MNPSETMKAAEARSCPKRIWVLATLSDDEALQPDGSLPPGLKFHLSRCPSCRLDADRLLAVSGSLQGLSIEQPPTALRDRANEQLAIALAHGAVLTGRVTVPYEGPDVHVESDAPPVRIGALNLLGRFAAAAAVVFAVGWAGIALFNMRPPNDNFLSPSNRVATPRPIRPESTDKIVISQQDQDSDQVVTLDKDVYEPRPFCSNLSESEDGLTEDSRCIQRAFSIPARGRRGPGPGRLPTPLDNSPASVSTTRLPNER